ncbi:MAG TPA: hypothetical protein VOA41_18095 [Candidatus Dormibacteraeota bacterium]|nr:hypothetical protein [Candidatus Dormibacteraeota bacterium]
MVLIFIFVFTAGPLSLTAALAATVLLASSLVPLAGALTALTLASTLALAPATLTLAAGSLFVALSPRLAAALTVALGVALPSTLALSSHYLFRQITRVRRVVRFGSVTPTRITWIADRFIWTATRISALPP